MLDDAKILDKLGICHEFAIWRLLVNGIPPRKPSDLIVKEMLFDRVPVMVCCPKRASPENRRGLVWIHGGAGLFGSPHSAACLWDYCCIYLSGTSAGVNEIMANAHVPQELMAKYQKWISAEHIPEEFKGRGYVPFVPGPFSEDLFQKYKTVFDPIFSPLLAEDAVIQQFPETFLLTCEYDIFRDDGLLYKKRLEDNGVPVTWLHLKDGFHGITLLIGMRSIQFPSTRKSMNSVIQFLERF
ncbi:arylacetamide deacetylase-like 4 [Crotalus tigris]|uniref:arylacetamide deacetylase-like 4 n=1 Tax=Crotalus tigris TaxID=88082 RepID=UPI00192F78F3|nr:arylacetamide deacetylase-like 4 [Crotalus tigris]